MRASAAMRRVSGECFAFVVVFMKITLICHVANVKRNSEQIDVACVDFWKCADSAPPFQSWPSMASGMTADGVPICAGSFAHSKGPSVASA